MLPKAKIKLECSLSFNSSLCCTCLSSDRKLRYLGDCRDIFQVLCSKNSSWDMKSEVLICWECKALLQKAKNFQNRAEQAQKIMSNYAVHKSTPISLSNLSIKQTVTDDFITEENKEIFQEPKEEITIETNNTEVLLEVKQEEMEWHNEYNNDFIDNYDYLVDDIKEEALDETFLKNLIKKNKPKKNKTKSCQDQRKYKYRLTKLNPEKVMKRYRFDVKELNDWLERERNSTYYKNLLNKCEKCLATIGHVSLEKHNNMYHTKTKTNKYECDICHQYLSTKASLGAHYKQHFFYYSCTLCGYKCYKKHNNRSHIKLHDRSVQCVDCEGTFRNTREFFEHWKTLHTTYQCDYCNEVFKTKLKIEKHIFRTHRSHRCEPCDVSFLNYRTYSEHMKLKHTIQRSETTYCVQCDIQFDNARQFNRHVTTAVAHTKERVYTRPKLKVPCPECPNVYARKVYMMNHYRLVHARQTKHQCGICQKLFLNSTRYKDHMLYKHEGRQRERKYICFMCGRGFHQKRILENHLRTHTGERPFECPHCDSKFAQKVALNSHIRFIHMKDKRKPHLVNNVTVPGITQPQLSAISRPLQC